MKPSSFELIRTSDLGEALRALRECQDRDAKLLAGGQSLIPMMNFRVAQPGALIDLGAVPGLDGIEMRDGTLCIGAMSRHNDVKAHALVAQHAPLVRAAYEYVAHHSIRNRGTLGGNLSHADPASEMPAVMLALDAVFMVRSVDAERAVPASEFFLAPFTTALEPDEMLLQIRIPIAHAQERFAFEEVSLRKGDFAISAVAAGLRIRDGRCEKARVSMAGISYTPLRAAEAEEVLTGEVPDAGCIARAVDAAVGAIEFNATAAITAEYRRDLTRTLMIRALSRAAAEQSETP